MKFFQIFLFIFFAAYINLSAQNQLTVKVPDVYTSYPGYIDKATLVVEPHGGYSEESLYLDYSDHHQFSAGQKVEIIQRFQLPQGSVINDLWLWIGDSVMQAIMLDTWKARAIYDSIVSMKRDPAFLSKKGDQYELHIYPLTPGSYRKIKLNFITPTRWIGNTAYVELPIPMLQSNNNSIKPLDIYFKEKYNIWGKPQLKELPEQLFVDKLDTAGFMYKYTRVNDITSLASLKLSYNMDAMGGVYFGSGETDSTLNYFQISLSMQDIFKPKIDSSSKKIMVGLDLSGSFDKNYHILLPNLKESLKSFIKPEDYFNIAVTGAGQYKKLSDNWIAGDTANIVNTLNSFSQSALADSINNITFPKLIYADNHAATCWGFINIDSLALKVVYSNLYQAVDDIPQANVVASYTQGYEEIPSSSQLPRIYSALDTMFINGGRFVTYFDYNRDGREPVATHYIKGLATLSQAHNSITLYRNNSGNIGMNFPEQIDHSGTYFLKYNDPDVKVELMDKDGNPAVISKRIYNGLIVVSGIWSFNDDATLKKMLAVPLLGLNNKGGYSQLPQLLTELKTEYSSNQYDKAIVISNSDSLILVNQADKWATNYVQSFGATIPYFYSINLLTGLSTVFPSVIVDNISYLGSGYLLKKIDELTGGLHFEANLNDWDYISSVLSPYYGPQLAHFSITESGDGDTSNIAEFREIKTEPQDPNSPKFFIGSTKAKDRIDFEVQAQFSGEDSVQHRSFSYPISYDTTDKKTIISSMLGYEHLKDLFTNASYDTTAIVDIALQHNLLCDYTALIALEPNDTLHFMQNPLDEGSLTSVTDKNNNDQDTVLVTAYPNPFNGYTRIIVKVHSPSTGSIYVYNILGQLVKTITEADNISGTKYFVWNSTNMHNSVVASGIYLLRVTLKDNKTGKQTNHFAKLMLLK